MHDIICPQCGGRFIARDVAFDLSQYVTTLLFDDPHDMERVQTAGFKFYADEESIITNTTDDNRTPLFCDSALGPDGSDTWYPYVVTGTLLLEYIESSLNNMDMTLRDLLAEIEDVQRGKNKRYNIQQINAIRDIYRMFFTSSVGISEFDIDDYNVQTAIRILLHLVNNEDKSITLRVRLYSSHHNEKRPDYAVPDILFIFDNGLSQRINKCCRYCGAHMPTEFGYYKMVPVVLLGSHFSGKTSFLLAMLFTVRYKAPFNSVNTKLTFTTLEDDKDLTAFNKNIERYMRGEPTLKTDFVNVPILNIRVNDTIYTFVDWPGEKFISANEEKDADFVFRKRRIIQQARHFICCLEPSQVDHAAGDTDENVQFPVMDLIERFKWHMSFPNRQKLRSITCAINKFDILSGKPNTSLVFDMISQTSESDVYSDTTWKEENFRRVVDSTKRYMENQNPILYSGFERMANFESIPKYYYPVSPYGKNPEANNGNNIVVHQASLAGMPLLGILKADGMI